MLEIEQAIADAAIAEPVKQRLRSCLPWLTEALATCVPVDALVIAAATPRGALIFASEAWPLLPDAKLDRGRVALSIHAAIEGGTEHDIILSGVSYLLGHAGLTTAAADAIEICRRGGFPIVAVLTELVDSVVTLLVSVVPLPPLPAPTLH